MWGDISLQDPGETSLSLADLEVRVARRHGVYRIHLDGAVANQLPAIPDGWREVHVGADTRLAIVPATPDLPVVLKPQEPIAVAPGQSVTYRVALPVWIRVVTLDRDQRRGAREETLLDLPVRTLKRTWFGTAEAGEVGYGWSFLPRAREAHLRHRFSVPLTVHNGSQSVLWFERLLLRVVHLDIYRVNAALESNGVTVSFKGSEQLSQITFEPASSVSARGGELLGGHRVSTSQDIIKRSFLWLRDLTT